MNTESPRRTIQKEIVIEGVGLHSGKKTILRCQPATAYTGILFTREKKYPGEFIEAIAENVVDTSLAVTIGNGKWRVQTIEHIMAALRMTGISDMIIDTDNIEIPILDGSAQEFIQAFNKAGIQEFENDVMESIQVKNALWVIDGDKYLIALPSDKFEVSYNIHFEHPLLKGQSYQGIISNQHFLTEIAAARTFGFLSQVEYLQSKGLALGGSIENAIVLDEKGYLNPSLRYDNECVRHKVLDLVGDLALIGRPLQAHIIANKAGHALDVALAKKILSVERENQFSFENLSSGNDQNKTTHSSILTKVIAK